MSYSIKSLCCAGLFGLLLFSIPSCVADKLPPIEETLNCDDQVLTYATEMKSIVDRTCAYEGCHIPGSSIGDFTSYQGMLQKLESGQVESRVIGSADMPPAFVEDDTKLTQEELDQFTCWIENGYPEQ